MDIKDRTLENWPRDKHGGPILDDRYEAILYGRLAAGNIFMMEQLRDRISYSRAVSASKSTAAVHDHEAAVNAAIKAELFREAFEEAERIEKGGAV